LHYQIKLGNKTSKVSTGRAIHQINHLIEASRRVIPSIHVPYKSTRPSLLLSLTAVHTPKPRTRDPLVVLGVLGVSEVKDDGAVRSGTTAGLGEDVLKVNRAVEAEGAVLVDVDPVTLVVTRSVDDGDL
jgi:hypothetical protein